jgi:ribose transport system ATP-binding protein
MHDYLAAGGAVLLYSTEIPEVANLRDGILVVYAGRVIAELDGRSTSEHEITSTMLGAGTAASTRVNAGSRTNDRNLAREGASHFCHA